MTLADHLVELRHRIVVSLLAFTVGSVVAYALYEPILKVLTSPLDAAGTIGKVKVENLYVPGITTAFVLRMKISAVMGVIFAMPVLLYQLWRFITPGLYPKEKRYAIPFVTSALALFAFGVWFSFQLLPAGIRFLLGFIAEGQVPLIQFHEYIGFVTFMMLAFGITFEFPLVLVFLALVGVIGSQGLRRFRRYAIFVTFLVAAVATPSGDPLTQTAMAVPLYILYEVAILVIRFALKR
jgi:sec-independent protein translocase protein TatC